VDDERPTLKSAWPLVGADAFVTNHRGEVCLVRRSDNGLWALPGGGQELGETPQQCAEREFLEETGLRIEATRLLGVFSSLRYEAPTNVNRGREYAHILFSAEIVGGTERTSAETSEIGWFPEHRLPLLSDGHSARVRFGFSCLDNTETRAHFE
jgi:ADP-ribose pyrophosphatase YjhB (NUDIX family)